MTAPARLPQAEYKRIFNAAKAAGVHVAIDLNLGRVEMLERGAQCKLDEPEELE